MQRLNNAKCEKRITDTFGLGLIFFFRNMQNISTLKYANVRDLWTVNVERYSRFVYSSLSFLCQVYWPSDRVSLYALGKALIEENCTPKSRVFCIASAFKLKQGIRKFD